MCSNQRKYITKRNITGPNGSEELYVVLKDTIFWKLRSLRIILSCKYFEAKMQFWWYDFRNFISFLKSILKVLPFFWILFYIFESPPRDLDPYSTRVIFVPPGAKVNIKHFKISCSPPGLECNEKTWLFKSILYFFIQEKTFFWI